MSPIPGTKSGIDSRKSGEREEEGIEDIIHTLQVLE